MPYPKRPRAALQGKEGETGFLHGRDTKEGVKTNKLNAIVKIIIVITTTLVGVQRVFVRPTEEGHDSPLGYRIRTSSAPPQAPKAKKKYYSSNTYVANLAMSPPPPRGRVGVLCTILPRVGKYDVCMWERMRMDVDRNTENNKSLS